MIEAVTGSGKTNVAIRGLLDLYREDRRISSLIVVPTLPLLDQWYVRLSGALRESFPSEQIGRIGGKYRDDFGVPPIAYIATIGSALRNVSDRFEHCWRKGFRSLLIADECHHYIDAPVWRKIAVDYDWTYRIGLSATIEPFQAPGLGSIVYTYKFADAFRDGLVPAFDLVNSSVALTPRENEEYIRLSREIGDQFGRIMSLYEISPSDQWLFKHLYQLMGRIGSGKEPQIEKLFRLLFKRAAIYYLAHKKLRLAEEAIRLLIESGRKVLVFFERIAAADLVDERIDRRAAHKLMDQLGRSSSGVWCKVCHSGLPGRDRDVVLGEFRDTRSGALLVCRSFDEGIDLPEVDAAILVASTQSKRQRIQRIGRTLRRGDGNKRPMIITLTALGTGDDRVTEKDRGEFEGVATLHEPRAANLITTLKSVLTGKANGNGSRVSSELPYAKEGPFSLLVSGDSLTPESVCATLTNHVKKGTYVRVVYAGGTTIEGRFTTCLSYAARIEGRTASIEGVTEIYVASDPADSSSD